MKIEKLKPVRCPSCNSSCFVKEGKNKEVCFSCDTIFDNGKEYHRTEPYYGGRDPKIDTGDYVEGSIGVHECYCSEKLLTH